MKHVQLHHGIVGTHIDPYMQCQCHVTSEIVSRLLGDVVSLMKYVKFGHAIVGTHIIHAMSISCNNTDCLGFFLVRRIKYNSYPCIVHIHIPLDTTSHNINVV